jgi:hypothetical protein
LAENKTNGGGDFHLSHGGFFSQALRKIHLASEYQEHQWRRIALLSAITWLPLLIFSALEGNLLGGQGQLSFLKDPAPYARYLIALPLMVMADTVIDPLLAASLKYLRISGIIRAEALPRFEQALDNLVRRRDSHLAEFLLLALAYALSFVVLTGYSDLDYGGGVASSWAWSPDDGLTGAGWWYLLVSAPLLQFVLYRWFWRFVIWVGFLISLSRLPLKLMATHTDHAGGLGVLAVAQNAFSIIFMAIAVMMSSFLAQDILFEGQKLEAVFPEALGYVIFGVVVISAPLLLFAKDLYRLKRRGMIEYGALHYRLSKDFHDHWIQGGAQDLVDSMQPSAMADYSAVYENVKDLRILPLAPRTVLLLALSLAAPFAPLVLTEIPFKEILERMAQTML